MQAQTAEFQADLGKANAKLNEFETGVKKVSRATTYSMRESRESVLLLGDAFGIHLPGGISRSISSLDGLGPALSAALPYVAIIAGIALIIEKIVKWRESMNKAAEDWKKVGNAGAEALHSAQEELLRTQIKADELSGHSLAALRKQLQLINEQTTDHIVSEIDKIGKAADKAFGELQHNWFMRFLMGSADMSPVKGEIDQMISALDDAKTKGAKPEDVAKMVTGDVSTVKAHMTDIWNQMEQYRATYSAHQRAGEYTQAAADDAELKRLQQQWDARQKELDTLNEISAVTNTLTEAGKIETKNTETGYTEKHETAIHVKPPDLKAYYESIRKRKEAEEKLASDQIAANDAVQKAINKNDIFDKMTQKAEQSQQAWKAAQAGMSLSDLDTQYRESLISVSDYLHQRRTLLQQEAEQEEQYYTQMMNAANQRADSALNSGDMAAYAAATAEADKWQDQLTKSTVRLHEEMGQLNAEVMHLAPTWNQAFSQMVNDMKNTLPNAAGQFRESFGQALKETNGNLAQTIVEGKNLGQSMQQVGAKMLESWIQYEMRKVEVMVMSAVQQNAVAAQSAAVQDSLNQKSRISDAKTAATAAFKWAMKSVPFPFDLVVAPAAAAAAFAGAMAFEHGGKIPGAGAVPIIGHGGETVVQKVLTDRVEAAERGGKSGGNPMHVHFSPTIHALDADGIDKVLDKHQDKFHRAFQNYQRRMGHA